MNHQVILRSLCWFCLCGALTVSSVFVGCKHDNTSDESTNGSTVTSGLPPLVLRDDTKDILLTWVDPTGDFHVVQTLNDVPPDAKDKVRVVLTTKDEGTTDPVYVADLRQKKVDQTYPVTTLPRASWEELGAAKRKARLEALAPVASAQAGIASKETPVATGRLVTIYGAKWCGACRQAKSYLTKKGVRFLEKDVDESPTVQAELRAKLSKAGMPPTSSIPILDVGGKVLVGFSQSAIDSALEAMKP